MVAVFVAAIIVLLLVKHLFEQNERYSNGNTKPATGSEASESTIPCLAFRGLRLYV